MCNVRPAQQEDVERMAEIEAMCFPPAEAASLEAFQQRYAVFPECFFVIDVDGLVVGHINGCVYSEPALPDALYADTRLHCPNGDYQTVFGLAVDPNYQARGYASILTQYFIDFSRKSNRKGVVLTCKDSLAQFYERFGFINQGVSASQHGGATWQDMLLNF